jgi:uncharacterized membrane protein (UPF0127 family)
MASVPSRLKAKSLFPRAGKIRYTTAMRRPLTGLVVLGIVCTFAGATATPQSPLPTVPLKVGDKRLTAEVADDDAEREAGMMFRKSIAEGEAMLFVFDAPQRASFWMKNTLVPLSVAYVARDGRILEIHDLKPRDETPVPSKFDTIAYAIEVPQGWFIKNAILPGSLVKGLPAPKAP